MLLALAVFAQGDGAVQLADALVFHTRTVRIEVDHVHGTDRCHAERCELGVPIASPPPITQPDVGDRFAVVYRRADPPAPTNPPRTLALTSPLGSRAPPSQA
jgi:hypothetical protein